MGLGVFLWGWGGPMGLGCSCEVALWGRAVPMAVPMGLRCPYGAVLSLWLSLWICMAPYGAMVSLWGRAVLMGLCCPYGCPNGSVWLPMGLWFPYRAMLSLCLSL